MRTPLNTAATFLREHRVIKDELIRSVLVNNDGITISIVLPTEAFVANFGSINFPEATVSRLTSESRPPTWVATFMWRKRTITIVMSVDASLGVPVENFSAEHPARS